ncbi:MULTISPECIES: AraC family transcriptional regulator [unclassified Burkholderia]|uniref:AraC family transcriptional regulator n=1 Tax=unclassified Burkholderia TaxID=2613784 RepID=UPI000F563A06|nr:MULTISPECIES: AraC family transcriptional regulator [unclassified Burkholderia]RQS26485.1 AraC family transcriptional regulator [Burkholderia sp. Bp8995]RQS48463.1 AraC family transcriptional regulator [Burkholderia sp. Bp8989]
MERTTRYTTANLQAYLLRCLAGMSSDLGIDPERLCLGLGFQIADLSDPECRLSFRQASEMIRRTMQLSSRDGIGLEIANNETIGSIGIVGYAMLTSPTFAEAVALGVSMQNYAGSMLELDYHNSDLAMSITATSRFHEPDIEAFLVEEAFGTFMKIGRTLIGDGFKPSVISFSYPRPNYSAEYERTFSCPLRFGQKDNVFSCDASWGERRIITYDPLSHRQALGLLETVKVQESEDTDLIESVERIIRRDLRNAPTLQTVAAQLCMSERTLRRKLAHYGLPYQSILDSVRERRALTLLQNSRLSIEEVSYEVGFSDSHNFRRAFKRWTGHGPRTSA